MEAKLDADPPSLPYPGGLHRCRRSPPARTDSEFRLFWHQKGKEQVEMALSDDLVTWRRANPMKAPYGDKSAHFYCRGLDDSWTFMSTDTDGSCRNMFAFAKACPRFGPGIIFKYEERSSSWKRIAETGSGHDRSSFWWNPFSSVFVFHVRLDFVGMMRTIWYFEAAAVNRTSDLLWEHPGDFGSHSKSAGKWYAELQRDWRMIDENPGRRNRVPLPYIALDAQDQRDLPNYNNSLVALEGDCLARGCKARHPGKAGPACRGWQATFREWAASKRSGPRPVPPSKEEVVSPDQCLRLTDVYSMEAVPYESLVVGLFALWQGGQMGAVKHTQVWAGFSRDGFHFDRPRPGNTPRVEGHPLFQNNYRNSEACPFDATDNMSSSLMAPAEVKISGRTCKSLTRNDPFYPGPWQARALGHSMTNEFDEDEEWLRRSLNATLESSLAKPGLYSVQLHRRKDDIQQRLMYLETLRRAESCRSTPSTSTLDWNPTSESSTAHRSAPSIGGLESAAFVRYPGAGWRNTQAVANGIQSFGDRTFIMYTARNARRQLGGVFTSSFRRDGFASMQCYSLCELVTVPLILDLPSGMNGTIWVNADAHRGTLSVEVLRSNSKRNDEAPILRSAMISGVNGTAIPLEWVATAVQHSGPPGGVQLSSAIRQRQFPCRLRFTATKRVRLFSFWVETHRARGGSRGAGGVDQGGSA
jgi:hypothetical protein